jgi:uncharacterized protein
MFDWDRANLRHIAEHGVTSAEAEEVINNNPFDIEYQYREEEERTVQLGETAKGRILVVVTTWRSGLIRVITAFPAPKSLRTLYLAQKGRMGHGEIQDP